MTGADDTDPLKLGFTDAIRCDSSGCQRGRIVGREHNYVFQAGVDFRNGRVLPISPTGKLQPFCHRLP